jgi:hypothetical protein
MLEDDTFFITEVSLSDSGLQRVAGALADHGGTGGGPGQRGWLRSWVTGWTHHLEVDARGLPQAEPIAGVGRLAEAVVDVLLERRPLEQMRRWLSREVAGMLTVPGLPGGGAAGLGDGLDGARVPAVSGGAPYERRAPRFAARSMIRSVRVHQPATGIVESTVVVQDGPRVRAVALRFERTAPPAQGPGRHGGKGQPGGFNWMCTALQFN